MRSSTACLRPPPHACTREPCAVARSVRPPAAVADPPPRQPPPLVALGPDSVGQLQPSVTPPGAGEPWLCSALEPTFDCPADRLTDVAELLAAGAIPPAALDLYSPRSADQLRRLVAVLHRSPAVQPSTLTRRN